MVKHRYEARERHLLWRIRFRVAASEASKPVAIDADTTYVASYHANNGHYSADQDYFANTGVDNPPLHALGPGGNGVFAYSRGKRFPK